MTIKIFAISILALLVLALLFLLRSAASAKLDIWNPPFEANTSVLGKSSVLESAPSARVTQSDRVLFETEKVFAVPLGVPGPPRLERSLVSIGDPRKSQPSRHVWHGGRFELHILFRIHNQSCHEITLNDIKAHVYHVSMYRLRPGDMLWRPRIELTMDNTADLTAIADAVQPGDAQSVELVLETSIFDTLFTTIVFGLFAFCGWDGVHHNVKVPSDHIFLFQHDHRWKAERCHFVSRDVAGIDRVAAETGSQPEFFESLRKIHDRHTNGTQESAALA